MAPPAESPVTKMREGSIPWVSTIAAIIWRIDSASPRSRSLSDGENQLKQRLGLLARCCSGNSSKNPCSSARVDQPEPRS